MNLGLSLNNLIQTNFENILTVLNYCRANNVDITREYENWNKVCLALISVYKDTDKGREYFHEFSKLNDRYNETECNEQYDKMLLYYKDNNKITVASLVYLYQKYSNKE
jgi:hypothetical protein